MGSRRARQFRARSSGLGHRPDQGIGGRRKPQATIVNHYYLLRMAQSPDAAEREAAAQRRAELSRSGGRRRTCQHLRRRRRRLRQAPESKRANCWTTLSATKRRLCSRRSMSNSRSAPRSPPRPRLPLLALSRPKTVPLEAFGRRQAEAARIYRGSRLALRRTPFGCDARRSPRSPSWSAARRR